MAFASDHRDVPDKQQPIVGGVPGAQAAQAVFQKTSVMDCERSSPIRPSGLGSAGSPATRWQGRWFSARRGRPSKDVTIESLRSRVCPDSW